MFDEQGGEGILERPVEETTENEAIQREATALFDTELARFQKELADGTVSNLTLDAVEAIRYPGGHKPDVEQGLEATTLPADVPLYPIKEPMTSDVRTALEGINARFVKKSNVLTIPNPTESDFAHVAGMSAEDVKVYWELMRSVFVSNAVVDQFSEIEDPRESRDKRVAWFKESDASVTHFYKADMLNLLQKNHFNHLCGALSSVAWYLEQSNPELSQRLEKDELKIRFLIDGTLESQDKRAEENFETDIPSYDNRNLQEKLGIVRSCLRIAKEASDALFPLAARKTMRTV